MSEHLDTVCLNLFKTLLKDEFSAKEDRGVIDKITLETNFRKDLRLDSMDLYELLYKTEEELGILICEDQVREMQVCKEYADYLQANYALELERFDSVRRLKPKTY